MSEVLSMYLVELVDVVVVWVLVVAYHDDRSVMELVVRHGETYSLDQSDICHRGNTYIVVPREAWLSLRILSLRCGLWSLWLSSWYVKRPMVLMWLWVQMCLER